MWFVILCRPGRKPEVVHACADQVGAEVAYDKVIKHGLPLHCVLYLAEQREEKDCRDSKGFPPTRNPWITPVEVAAELRCSLSHVYVLIQTGELDGFANGRLKMVYRHSLDAYRERHALRGKVKAARSRPAGAARRKETPPAGSTPFRHLR